MDWTDTLLLRETGARVGFEDPNLSREELERREPAPGPGEAPPQELTREPSSTWSALHAGVGPAEGKPDEDEVDVPDVPSPAAEDDASSPAGATSPSDALSFRGLL